MREWSDLVLIIFRCANMLVEMVWSGKILIANPSKCIVIRGFPNAVYTVLPTGRPEPAGLYGVHLGPNVA
jgi:hypothetical protein